MYAPRCLSQRRSKGQTGGRRLGASFGCKRHSMNRSVSPRLDVIIPVYNEGANIRRTLQSIARAVKTPLRVLICYDTENDDTLPAIKNNDETLGHLDIKFVRNRGHGAH